MPSDFLVVFATYVAFAQLKHCDVRTICKPRRHQQPNRHGSMRKVRGSILWSPMPMIPLFWVGLPMTKNMLVGAISMLSRGETISLQDLLNGWQYLMVAAATVLGMFGCIGLVVAALPITYRTPLLRHAAMFGLAAGFFAWIVIAFWVLMAFSVTIGEPRDGINGDKGVYVQACLLYTSPSPRDATLSRMPSSA